MDKIIGTTWQVIDNFNGDIGVQLSFLTCRTVFGMPCVLFRVVSIRPPVLLLKF